MCWSICYLSDFDLKRNKKLQLHITTSYKLHIEKKITNTMRDELLLQKYPKPSLKFHFIHWSALKFEL